VLNFWLWTLDHASVFPLFHKGFLELPTFFPYDANVFSVLRILFNFFA